MEIIKMIMEIVFSIIGDYWIISNRVTQEEHRSSFFRTEILPDCMTTSWTILQETGVSEIFVQEITLTNRNELLIATQASTD